MKSKEFITEDDDNKKVVLIDKKTINILNNECSEFLNKFQGNFFYRGFRKNKIRHHLTKIPIREDRRPRDTDPEETAVFNTAFEQKFGIPYIRNISSFITTNQTKATEYGNICEVFPVNGTKYTYSNTVGDLIERMTYGTDYDIFTNLYIDSMKLNKEPTDKIKKISDTLKSAQKYIQKVNGKINIDQAKKIFGDAYLIWYDYMHQFHEIVDSYKVYNHYNHSISSHDHEVMIFGAPYFYALNLEYIAYLARDLNVYVGGEKLDPYLGHEEKKIKLFGDSILSGVEVSVVANEHDLNFFNVI